MSHKFKEWKVYQLLKIEGCQKCYVM